MLSPFHNFIDIKLRFEDFEKSNKEFQTTDNLIFDRIIFDDLIFNWAKTFERAFSEHILSLNFPIIIIFIALWLLISFLIGEIRKSIEETKVENQSERIGIFSKNPVAK